MKEIKKIQIWSNGENIELNYITIHIKFDDLINVCVFSYDLLKDEQSIVNGEIILNGNEYLEWSGNNDEAFNIILQKLNLELI